MNVFQNSSDFRKLPNALVIKFHEQIKCRCQLIVITAYLSLTYCNHHVAHFFPFSGMHCRVRLTKRTTSSNEEKYKKESSVQNLYPFGYGSYGHQENDKIQFLTKIFHYHFFGHKYERGIQYVCKSYFYISQNRAYNESCHCALTKNEP